MASSTARTSSELVASLLEPNFKLRLSDVAVVERRLADIVTSTS